MTRNANQTTKMRALLSKTLGSRRQLQLDHHLPGTRSALASGLVFTAVATTAKLFEGSPGTPHLDILLQKALQHQALNLVRTHKLQLYNKHLKGWDPKGEKTGTRDEGAHEEALPSWCTLRPSQKHRQQCKEECHRSRYADCYNNAPILTGYHHGTIVSSPLTKNSAARA
jgi:hypothetical protein